MRSHLAHGIGQLGDRRIFLRLVPIDLWWPDHGLHWVDCNVGDGLAQAFGERMLECVDRGVPGCPVTMRIVDLLRQIEVHWRRPYLQCYFAMETVHERCFCYLILDSVNVLSEVDKVANLRVKRLRALCDSLVRREDLVLDTLSHVFRVIYLSEPCFAKG